MWFAFDLWNTDIDNNGVPSHHARAPVVICFRSLKYWYWQQPFVFLAFHHNCCDLLSIFEILILTTTINFPSACAKWLWFAFDLWNTDIDNNNVKNTTDDRRVVICFRSLKYWYWQQHTSTHLLLPMRCDLLSIFEILILTTTYHSV